MKKIRIIYPFLFALFPALSLYAHNIGQVKVKSLLYAVLASLLLAFVIFRILSLFYKDPGKTGLVVTFILSVFFAYGHAYQLVIDWYRNTYTYKAVFNLINTTVKYGVLLHIILGAISFLIIAAVVIGIKRSKAIYSSFTKVFNFVSIALLISPLVIIGSYKIQESPDTCMKIRNSPFLYGSQTGVKRDIYYIIVDGYARADILKEFYGFDNSEFINYLRKSGFFVASRSCSNYAWTFLSLPSSLNLEYINYLSYVVGKNSKDLSVPYKMIENNRVMDYLKSQGYHFVFFGSTWGGTASNRYADLEIGNKKAVFGDEFLMALARTTMLRLADLSIEKDLAKVHLYSFEMLGAIPRIKEPTFTFLHIMLPHHPFIFDRFGNIRKHATIFDQFQQGGWNDKDGYIDQVIFVNNKLKTAITALLKESEIAPIIIIQSDHGPQIPQNNAKDFVRARMANFQAYYLPDGKSEVLYDSITSVNTFRIIFNSYFRSGYKLLNDKCYYSEFGSPYALSDVTQECY